MISGNRFPITGTQADNTHDGIIRLVFILSAANFSVIKSLQDAGQAFPGFS